MHSEVQPVLFGLGDWELHSAHGLAVDSETNFPPTVRHRDCDHVFAVVTLDFHVDDRAFFLGFPLVVLISLLPPVMKPEATVCRALGRFRLFFYIPAPRCEPPPVVEEARLAPARNTLTPGFPVIAAGGHVLRGRHMYIYFKVTENGG